MFIETLSSFRSHQACCANVRDFPTTMGIMRSFALILDRQIVIGKVFLGRKYSANRRNSIGGKSRPNSLSSVLFFSAPKNVSLVGKVILSQIPREHKNRDRGTQEEKTLSRAVCCGASSILLCDVLLVTFPEKCREG